MMAKHLRSDSVVRQLAHLVPRLYSNLLPTPCFLCGNQTRHGPVCQQCLNELPRLGHHCPRCAIPMPDNSICGACLQNPPPQHKSISLFLYTDPVDRCIAAFKYQRHLGFAPLFAQLMADMMQDQCPTATIIPVPLHPVKLRLRGFNQSHEIARLLARHLTLPVDSYCLQRTRNTPSQSSLPLKARQKNLNKAFSCTGTAPDSVILIDDVLTSGHTVKEAAKTLHNAGCNRIEVWTIARAISHY